MSFHFLNVLGLGSEAERRLLGSKRTWAVEAAWVLGLGGRRVRVERCWDGLYGLFLGSAKDSARDGVVEKLVESQRVRRVHRVMVSSLFRRRVP
jgi:hypothetical protein